MGSNPEVGAVEIPPKGRLVVTHETQPRVSGDMVESRVVDSLRRCPALGGSTRGVPVDDGGVRGGPHTVRVLREHLLGSGRAVPRDASDGEVTITAFDPRVLRTDPLRVPVEGLTSPVIQGTSRTESGQGTGPPTRRLLCLTPSPFPPSRHGR